MSVIMSFPGKMGDAILQWPVAYQWHRRTLKKLTLWLDKGTCGPLVPLFENQPCVEAVELREGITNYTCGGQPWNFGIETSDVLGHAIHHLGFRKFPERQITLQTAVDVFPHEDPAPLEEQSLFVDPAPVHNRLVLHGTFTSHQTGVPKFWRFLFDHKELLGEAFDEVVFVGMADERKRALELYPGWKDFDDGGSFLELARFMAASRMVIGSGSSACALAGALKIPCVRVHDPIGEMPKVIWSNLGESQLNGTEIELRKAFPEFLGKYAAVKA